MRFKVLVQSISASGIIGDTADLTPPVELTEAQRQLTKLIQGRNAWPTADGWMCQSRDGTRYVLWLDQCQPEIAAAANPAELAEAAA